MSKPAPTYTGADIVVLLGLSSTPSLLFLPGSSSTPSLLVLSDQSSTPPCCTYKTPCLILCKRYRARTATVSDNGRGIPVDRHPQKKKPALEVILTTLHAGGKFESDQYVTSGGLHGVGASVVNALSSELIARVKRSGKK